MIKGYSMGFHRLAPLFSLCFAVLVLAVPVLAVPVVAAPEPVALRVFYSSNLHGEMGPCG